MDINATLFGEILTFLIFIIFTMKVVWPPLMKAIEERQKKIADGLAAAERGAQSLILSQDKSKKMLSEARGEAASIINQATQRATVFIEESKVRGLEEYSKLVTNAKDEIEREIERARGLLRQEVVDLAMKSAEKIIMKKIDKKTHDIIVDQIIADI